MGQVNGEIRSAAAEFSSEWTPGIIPYDTQTKLPISDTPENTTLHQIYYIQQGNSSDPISPDYNREYATWPASQGAPAQDGEVFSDENRNGQWDVGEAFEDFDLNGSYDGPDAQLITGEDPPLFRGDHMAWWVMNDWNIAAHGKLWGTPRLGVEAQVLVYTRSDDPILENVQFRSVTLVNKGGEQIDSSFIGIWTDPDIGNASDDQGGCDTSLDMEYFYNGSPRDQDYGMTPPAVGYTFLQGPVVDSPGDSIQLDGKTWLDQRFLGMTASILILKSFAPFHDPPNANEAYFYMQGLQSDGASIIDPWGNITPFHVSGDPVVGDEWTGMEQYWSGDRRGIVSSGPFPLAPWDDIDDNGIADFGEPGVQIFKTALIIKSGVNNLDAITNLRAVTEFTRYKFDTNFEDFEMDPPQLNVGVGDGEITLNWYEEAETYDISTWGGYQFEGYNLYQGASITGPWTLLNTYDIINEVGLIQEQHFDENDFLENRVVQFGDDSGVEHLLTIRDDVLLENSPIINNKAYFFAIDAYAYSEGAIPKSIASERRILTVRPHLNYGSATTGELLEILHEGNAEPGLSAEVLDPSQLTGYDYSLGFQFDTTNSLGRYHITRRSESFQDTALQSPWVYHDPIDREWDGGTYYLDGFEFNISDISYHRPRYNHTWQQTTNIEGTTHEILTLHAVSPGGIDSVGWELNENELVHLDTLYGPDYYWDWFEIEERSDGTYFILRRENTHNVFIQAFASNFGAIHGDRIADIPNIGGGSTDIIDLQSDLEIRFTEMGQLATRYLRRHNDTLITVPFEVWDVERNMQLCIGIKDNNKTGGIQDTSLTDWENTLDLDWVIVFFQDYAIHSEDLQALRDNPNSGWGWVFYDESKFSVGDVLKLQFLNPVQAGVDVFQWSTDVTGLTYDEDALASIQVFPNPYFGYHADQTTMSGPFVTFSNLPEQECTIRIYSLGGHLVKRFDHEIGAYENWNLLNEGGHRVASGIYIVHIEVPDLGHKILKLAVLQLER